MAYKEINLKTFKYYLCKLPNEFKKDKKFLYRDITDKFNQTSDISSNEYIFEMDTEKNYIKIIIFSSILLDGEVCRNIGGDSIKLVYKRRELNGEITYARVCTHTYRVDGTEKNLYEKLYEGVMNIELSNFTWDVDIKKALK